MSDQESKKLPSEKELLAAILREERLANEKLEALKTLVLEGFQVNQSQIHVTNQELTVANVQLKQISDKLDQNGQPPDVGGYFVYHVLGIVPRDQDGGSMPIEVTCSQAEAYRLQVKPTTTAGKPAKIQSGSLTVVADDPRGPNIGATQVKIESDDTFLVAANLADETIPTGSTTFTVSGDADLGAGVVNISDTVLLNVTTEMAANLGVTGVGAVSRDSVGIPKP